MSDSDQEELKQIATRASNSDNLKVYTQAKKVFIVW